jgi:hypothetical protein
VDFKARYKQQEANRLTRRVVHPRTLILYRLILYRLILYLLILLLDGKQLHSQRSAIGKLKVALDASMEFVGGGMKSFNSITLTHLTQALLRVQMTTV